jgi:hypothetical protein
MKPPLSSPILDGVAHFADGHLDIAGGNAGLELDDVVEHDRAERDRNRIKHD